MSASGFDRRARTWTAVAIVYAVVLFVGGSIHAPPGGADYDDKLAHLIAFGGQYLLVSRAAAAAGASRQRQVLGGACIAMGLGGCLELWQALLPHRTADIADFIADGAGALAAAMGEEIVRQVRRPT